MGIFGSICCCDGCQTEIDANYEEGRRLLIKYFQHELKTPDHITIIEKYYPTCAALNFVCSFIDLHFFILFHVASKLICIASVCMYKSFKSQ